MRTSDHRCEPKARTASRSTATWSSGASFKLRADLSGTRGRGVHGCGSAGPLHRAKGVEVRRGDAAQRVVEASRQISPQDRSHTAMITGAVIANSPDAGTRVVDMQRFLLGPLSGP